MVDHHDSPSPHSQELGDCGPIEEATEELSLGGADVASMEGEDPEYFDSDELSFIGSQSSTSYASDVSQRSDDEDGEPSERETRSKSRVIAIGLPSDQAEASAGIPIPRAAASSDQGCSTDSDDDEEQAQPPPRHLRTPSDANQEVISEVVAESMAEQEHNEKAGVKKTLPHETTTTSTMLRRESSAIYRQKVDPLNCLTGGESPSSLSNLKRTSTTFSSDGTILVNSNVEEQVSQELEAQAGIPVVMPGAFAMEGINPDTVSGYDSGFDASDDNDGGEVPPASEDNFDVSDPEMAPSSGKILPAELHPSERQEEFVDGEIVPRENSQRKQLLRGRVVRVTILVLVVGVFAAIIAAVLVSRSGDDSSSPSDNGTPTGWEKVGDDLRGPSTDDGEEFGHSLSLAADGQRIAVGLPGWDDGSSRLRVGQSRILDWDGTEWILSAEFKGPGVGAEAGSSVALAKNGERVAIGSPSWDGRGQVQVYQSPVADDKDGTASWSIVGSPLLGDDGVNGQFGSSVAFNVDGELIAVGSPFMNGTAGDDTGLVRVYRFLNSSWTQVGRDLEGDSDLDLFGWDVALSADGQRLIASAIGGDSPTSTGDFTGQVRVYTLEGSQWEQLGQALYGTRAQDRFGHSLSCNEDGTILAIGTNVQGRNPGYVQVFQYDSDKDEYSQIGETIVGEADFDSFGYSVSLNALGDTVAVGSPSNDSGGRDAGQTRVFNYNRGTSSWIQELGEINGFGENESYGWSVSISSNGRRVASGAPMADFDGRLFEVGRVEVYEAAGFDGQGSLT